MGSTRFDGKWRQEDVDGGCDPFRNCVADPGVEVDVDRSLPAGESDVGRFERSAGKSECYIDAGVESECADANHGSDVESHDNRIDSDRDSFYGISKIGNGLSRMRRH